MSAPTQPTADGEAAHTPTPWRTAIHAEADGSGRIYSAVKAGNFEARGSSITIAKLSHLPGFSEEQNANAELIVRAVNSHAALVSALENMVSGSEYSIALIHSTANPKSDDPVDWKGVALHMYASLNSIDSARAALKLAK